jgi:hypothetical protein
MGILALISPLTDAVNSVVAGINKPITEREVIRQTAENERVTTTQWQKTLRTLLIASMSVLSVFLVTMIFLKKK